MTDVTYASPSPARRSDFLGAIAAAAMVAVFLVGWLFDVQSFAFFLLTMAVDAGMIVFFAITCGRLTFTLPLGLSFECESDASMSSTSPSTRTQRS